MFVKENLYTTFHEPWKFSQCDHTTDLILQ